MSFPTYDDEMQYEDDAFYEVMGFEPYDEWLDKQVIKEYEAQDKAKGVT